MNNRSSSLRPGNPQQLTGQTGLLQERLMDTLGQGERIGVLRTDNHARVRRIALMQAGEISPIEGQQSPCLSGSESQYLFIRNTQIGLPGIQGGEHIVATCSQLRDYLQGEILV